MRNPDLRQHLLNAPLALLPARAASLLAEGGASDFQAPADWGIPGYEIVDGIACIEVRGLLLPRLGTLFSWGWITGYDGIAANLADALANPAVNGIVLDIDSPGGAVTGCFDLVDQIYAAREVKPIAAICSENAFSAGYAIASAASVISVPRTGGVGSVGVITALVDMSKAIAGAGLAVHFVTFGRDKAAEARAEVTGVTDDVLASVQADVDRLGALFVDTVARNRDMQAAAVRATEAACYAGEAGVEIGFADLVASPAEAFAAFRSDVGSA